VIRDHTDSELKEVTFGLERDAGGSGREAGRKSFKNGGIDKGSPEGGARKKFKMDAYRCDFGRQQQRGTKVAREGGWQETSHDRKASVLFGGGLGYGGGGGSHTTVMKG